MDRKCTREQSHKRIYAIEHFISLDFDFPAYNINQWLYYKNRYIDGKYILRKRSWKILEIFSEFWMIEENLF